MKKYFFIGLLLCLPFISFADESTKWIATGFDVENANGVYEYRGEYNGAYEYVRDDNSYYLWYDTAGYWYLGPNSDHTGAPYWHLPRYDYSEGQFACTEEECQWQGGSQAGTFEEYSYAPTYGCMTPEAYNYNPLADHDDGTCITASSTMIAISKGFGDIVFALAIIIVLLLINFINWLFNSLFTNKTRKP